MKAFKSFMIKVVVMIFLISLLVGFTKYYSYIFVKTVSGEIVSVERVTEAAALLSTVDRIDPAQLYSYAVAIRDGKNEIVTASAVDRQWAVAQKGQCAEAKFYPYPPWNLDKGGTFYNARLMRLYDCPTAAIEPAAQ